MQNPSVVLYGPHNAKIEDRPIPELVDAHDVIIRINYVGVCGSDVHFWHHGGIGKMVNPSTGLVMGHEASGTIHSVGSSVKTVKPGDRVAIEPGVPCRVCKACKSGTYNLCRNIRFAAAPGPPDTPGTLSKYFRCAEDFVYKIPETIGLDEAVLVEPIAVAVHAVKLGDIRPGETVVVMGSGTIGLFCAAVARQFGAHRIIIVDILEKKLEFAANFLKCETYLFSMDISAEDNAENLLNKFDLVEYGIDTTGGLVDTVIEASGATASIETGIHMIRPGGKYVQTGLGKPIIEFPIVAMGQKELMMRGCFRYGAGDYELAVKLLENGLIDVKPLITSVTLFEQATDAWEKTSRGDGIKNLILGVQN
ncbi:Tdh Threonine dehydrogenase [Pyrenophora tritici-repentis]|uniref:D-xylulose reductase n=1 Tax=Pyrenophora tritici-repentis TaxID=45151 RepID=A0A2W1DZ49_9PLEO|nr:Sorbitol dehydrogenase [Pyrenophora tritici-repentis]KAF7446926.1 Sorbitol dehydrogenase [Pyrenophora tritici-repentis]KAF7569208.1 Tdh, Threonine dehydrogenase and related Zn-dependent dehydrogenase [Pyrenophora tritici-repentis]KAG9383007.1 Sorbitol dehydrogenase [Pyrenophora tritici-repentis]KAI0573318.1 Sorbitol dehydrogenase [Pyrenophora tritici-repentis]